MKIGDFLLGKGHEQRLEEIHRENRLAIHYLAIAGMPLGVINLVLQYFVTEGAVKVSTGIWLLVYFLFLGVADRFLLPQKCNRSTLWVYVLEAPVMILAILLGTCLDPGHQAITFLMFTLMLPVFILDRPIRVIAVFGGWTVAFVVTGYFSKNEILWRLDTLHALEFYLSSVAVALVVLNLRFAMLDSFSRTEYHLRHDTMTNTLNRLGLAKNLDRYLGNDIMLILGDINDLTLINDFHGTDVGDEVICSFAEILKEVFGPEDTYRYGGDELLAISTGRPREEVIRELDRCREKLAKEINDRYGVRLSSSFGYVTGTLLTEEMVGDMVQLAENYVHGAQHHGERQIVGGEFSKEALRRARSEASLNHAAAAFETNQITGLPSMSFFLTRSEEILKDVADIKRAPVVGLLKLDRFRDFNEVFGYTQGDQLIQEMGKLLRHLYPKRHIGHITGSQFCILCYQDEIEEGMEQLQSHLATYKSGYPVGLNAGFAPYHKGDKVISLLDKARMAYSNLEEGESWKIYDEHLDEENRFHQYILSHLDEAMEKGYIQAYYQPIVRALTGKICNQEALARWIDPVYGFLPPYRFIGLLEKERVIYKLSLYMVKQILEGFRRQREEGCPLVPVSINLSRYDFYQCDMVKEIADLVDASGFPRELLQIEITESAFVENPEFLKSEVDRFRKAGFAVWMDDFGSEYSTLNLLQDLNFDLIKIDMQFMRDFVTDGRNQIIVENIIDMCKRMGITTLVEGVETKEHMDILRGMGCEKLQGFLFYKPCSLDDIIAREKAGLRIPVEEWRDAFYYGRIGKLDITAPLSYDPGYDFTAFQSVFSGILEQEGENFYCLEGTEGFYRICRDMGLLEASGEVYREKVILREEDGILEVIREADKAAWAKGSIASPLKGGLTVLGHLVVSHPQKEKRAYLLVFLPAE